jgi:hypothetical protein
VPANLFAIMGGVRLSPQERVLVTPVLFGMAGGWLSAPLWIIGALFVYARSEPGWTPPERGPRARIGRSLWGLGLGVIFFFVALLPFTQPEQQLRGRVERAFAAGRFEDGIAVLTSNDRAKFPPHWEPPSRGGPELIRATDAATRDGVARWVRTFYVKRLQEDARDLLHARYGPGRQQISGDALVLLADVLERIDEGPVIARAMNDALEITSQNLEHPDDAKPLQRIRARGKR